jgi:hypothetical protein
LEKKLFVSTAYTTTFVPNISTAEFIAAKQGVNKCEFAFFYAERIRPHRRAAGG